MNKIAILLLALGMAPLGGRDDGHRVYVPAVPQYGVYPTQFKDGHVGWSFGWVTGDAKIYVINEVPAPNLDPPGASQDDIRFFRELQRKCLGD